MNLQRFTRQEIALHQLETALALFSGQGDLFSVITLAGAAEEILGQLLQQRGGYQGMRGVLTPICQILRPLAQKGRRREAISEAGGFVHLDPHREALFLLGRAIKDYVALSGAPSAAMAKFLSEGAAEHR